MPAATPPARIPGTAVTPPSSHSTSAGAIALGVHRWRLESRALGPTEHDVEVLDAVGRPPFAEIGDRRQAHGATGPPISDRRDGAVVRADDPARRRPLALVQHADERLAGVGLAVDAEELGRRECRGEGHGGGGEKPAVERDEVGREGDAEGSAGERAELLLDLGRVAVARDPVRLHVLVRFGVEGHRLGLSALRPGAGQAGLATYPYAVEPRRPAL